MKPAAAAELCVVASDFLIASAAVFDRSKNSLCYFFSPFLFDFVASSLCSILANSKLSYCNCSKGDYTELFDLS